MPANIVVGRILSSWGVRGEVKILPLTYSTDRFSELSEVVVSIRGEEKTLTIENCRIHDRFIIIKFAEINSPEEAKLYRGTEIKISEDQSPPLPEGIYYHYQIIGLHVYTTTSRYLGQIHSIIETGGNDVYVVKGDKEYMIPATEEFIKNIDLEKKTMIIEPVEGLLE
ncbi:MAG: 16S rRNA processing protein RimM [Nitrospirae bacterium]|nr:16S rRNA processing protein RimM [Nitrospirota bacterium]